MALDLVQKRQRDLVTLMVGDPPPIFEELSFYRGTIRVRYDDLRHKYYRATDGQLFLLDGATTVVHIVDKPAIIPWACKMMQQKLLLNIPHKETPDGNIVIPQMPLADFEIFVADAKSAHKDKLDDAANVGKQAHFYLECQAKLELGLISQMPPVPEDPRAVSCINDALAAWGAHRLVWRAAERKVMSRELDVCGTLDGLVQVSSCSNPFCCPHPFENETALLDYKTSNYLFETFLYQAAFYVHAVVEEFNRLDVRHRFIFKLGKEDGQFASWHCYAEDQAADFAGFVHCLDLTRNLRAAKERMAAVEGAQKDYAKLQKAEARQAERMLDCGKKDYKGIRAARPKCVNGESCETCLSLWLTNHPTVVN